MFILWIKFVERVGEMDGSIGEIDVENIADGLEVFGEGKLLTIARDNLSGIEDRSEDTDDVRLEVYWFLALALNNFSRISTMSRMLPLVLAV